ncbi:hypothetical protein CP960_11030 [Malaciobacter halophilus]|uniref:Uncharacterized protein n=1 Tax=Malaciobacter halophilus TaxID=197482 RepID=A0A2N1J0R6_9BACT|nr:hypothetical protein [Malaciobacter halophilus]AXH08429.1 hypothetical protein AHALO_0008 [Malaciobacter halophilus]PKI80149.1 hypothetical protein CP960_11030 [Malaciobacter halophilus]
MRVSSMNLKQKLDIAKTSKKIEELETLVESESMLVRRAIARNENINEKIANQLAFDPVLNVSYMACKNSNCTQKRDFSSYSLIGCVVCKKDEREIDCQTCKNKKVY